MRFLANESGATAIEYGLIAAIMAVGLLAALGGMNGSVLSMYGAVKNAMVSSMP